MKLGIAMWSVSSADGAPARFRRAPATAVQGEGLDVMRGSPRVCELWKSKVEGGRRRLSTASSRAQRGSFGSVDGGGGRSRGKARGAAAERLWSTGSLKGLY